MVEKVCKEVLDMNPEGGPKEKDVDLAPISDRVAIDVDANFQGNASSLTYWWWISLVSLIRYLVLFDL